MNKPISHSYATLAAPNAHTQKEIKGKTPATFSMSVPEVHSEAIYHPEVSARVGCTSDKLAWIKCQPWSRFTLSGATVNLLISELVRHISAGSILST